MKGTAWMGTALAAVLAVAAFWAQAAPDDPRSAVAALRAWDIGRATGIASRLGPGSADPDEAAYVRALCAFHEGEFAKAEAELKSIGVKDENVDRLRELAAGSRAVTAGYLSEVSAGGHFRFRYPPGPAGVLAAPAMEALERQREALSKVFGPPPPEVITVDIVGSAADLAAMTGLSETEISDTGTVAVCKYNRIMLTTPEALVNGYPYLDTLGHEYAHYVVSRQSGDRVEVWLQEAIAKTYEGAWRSGAKTLRPDQEGALAAAIAGNRLIPFLKMSPSMAKLPDSESASLAFAEVASALEFLRSKKGDGVSGEMVSSAARDGMKGALGAAGYGSLGELEAAWRSWAKARYTARIGPVAFLYRNTYKIGGGKGGAAETGEAGDPAAGRFLRLGDIMMARGKTVAALKEYQKAAQKAMLPDPVIANRLAVAYLAGGQPQRSLESLKVVDAIYPDYLSTLMNSARALQKLGKPADAAAYLKRASAINPFDPEVWNRLASVSEATGDRKGYDAAKENLRLITGAGMTRAE